MRLLFLIMFLTINIIPCFSMEKIDRAMVDRANRQMDEGRNNEELWRKNIEAKIYVGMSIDDFKSLFQDCITKEEENIIYFSEPETGGKSRVTFTDDLLSKYERFGRWYGIYGTGNYADVTFALRGYKNNNAPGFYTGMSENEFLNLFSASILSHSRNHYVVIGKNGAKYRLTFSIEGFLIGVECLR